MLAPLAPGLTRRGTTCLVAEGGARGFRPAPRPPQLPDGVLALSAGCMVLGRLRARRRTGPSAGHRAPRRALGEDSRLRLATGAATIRSTRRLAVAVRKVHDLATSRREAKDVTLDPATAEIALELTSAIPTACLLTTGSTQPPQVAEELVRAYSAFSRLRILHAPLALAISNLSVESWRGLPAPLLVEAVNAHAFLDVEDARVLRTWAEALDNETLARLPIGSLASLVWAAATLRMGRLGGLSDRLLGAVRKLRQEAGPPGRLDRRTGPKLMQLGKLAWGLAKLSQATGGPPRPALRAWARSVTAALRSMPVPEGQSLAQLLWVFAYLGQHSTCENLFERAKETRTPVPMRGRRGPRINKDAYAALLRDSGPRQSEVLRHMAGGCGSRGLRSAVLNAAAGLYLRGGEPARAREVLEEMAEEELWSPVTYVLAERLAKAGGAPGRPLEGRPTFPGLLDPGAASHKYVKAAYHALRRATAGDPASVLAGLEDFSRTKSWLKFGAADEKGAVIEEALRGLPAAASPKVAVEYGTFLGYSALKMALCLGPGTRIVSLESDPEVACLAMNLIEFAGADADIDVWVGQCEDLAPRLADELGQGHADVVYMDHNQVTYHRDVAQLEALGVLAEGSLLVATQALKPGAPLLLWRLAKAQEAGRCALELVSAPDCGCPQMEEWVVLARYGAAEAVWEPPGAPREIALLAAECNLMRWRTSRGLVNERTWNCFVQHVRRGAEESAGLRSTREAWPDLAVQKEARKLQYERMDFF